MGTRKTWERASKDRNKKMNNQGENTNVDIWKGQERVIWWSIGGNVLIVSIEETKNRRW